MFFASIILNLFSSYFLASIFNNFLIVFVSFFAFVVLNIEILSLFKAINPTNIFLLSILNFVFAFIYFKFKKIKLLKLKFDFARLKNSLFLDKGLLILAFSFLVLLALTFFFSIVMPVMEPDSQSYHFLRAYEFVSNQSLNHFETNDIRALIMPINSEIFYSYLLAFKKNFYGYGILSFFSYILIILSMWKIFEKFKFSFRKRLYAIFILSSLPAIIVQMPSLQTDLLVGALLICAFSLFIEDKIFFSSLALALALGTKTTAFIALFGFFILLFLYQKFISKNDFSKIKPFLLYLTINFLIFSSYNYILNFIQFGSFFSNHASYIGHKFWGGFFGYISNLIHFIFQSLDFTGFKWGYYLNDDILEIRNSLFNFLNISSNIGCNVEQEKINIITDEQIIGFGILGFLVFLPMVFISIFKSFFNKNKRTILCSIFGIVFLINILVLSASVAYMVYSIRFVVSFVSLSSIILIGCYRKKSFIKPIILFFCLFYMLILPFNIRRMPYSAVITTLKKDNYDLAKFEEDCYRRKVVDTLEMPYYLYDTILEKYSDKKNIAFSKKLSSFALYLKKLEYKGYKIDFVNPYFLNNDDYKKYDLIILEDKMQKDNVFNPSDIFKKYTEQDGQIIFNNNKNFNCYFMYRQNFKDNNEKDAVERFCFTYPYLIQDKTFKLDYVQNIYLKSKDENEQIYYFIRRIDGVKN